MKIFYKKDSYYNEGNKLQPLIVKFAEKRIKIICSNIRNNAQNDNCKKYYEEKGRPLLYKIYSI